MIKQNKNTLIITSIIIIIPILAGRLLWNKLPEQIPTHWDINGNIDGWSSKSFGVLGLPGVLLGAHWLCALACSADPKSRNYTPKMLRLVLWICPVMSLLVSSLTYCAALGYQPNVQTIMPLLLGVMFIILGNMLPKCRQSYTMGIKLPWTLASEENWNKTHRMAGRLWVAGGVLIMATAFLSSFWVLFGVLMLMVLIPTAYSYLYYRKHEENK